MMKFIFFADITGLTSTPKVNTDEENPLCRFYTTLKNIFVQIKRIRSFIFGFCFLWQVAQIQAQTPQDVIQGSIQHYHVTDHTGSGYSYAWVISPAVAGNSIAAPSAASTNITWGATGTYTITLTETNTVGACATTNTFQVLVVGVPTIQFIQSSSSGCAEQSSDLNLSFKKADGTAVSASDAGYFPLQVNYTLNGSNRSVIFNAGDELKLTLTASDRADFDPWVSSRAISVVLTSALANGGGVTIGSPSVHTNTVYDLPEINPIVAD